MSDKVKEIIMKVIGWGLGGVMMIAGILLMGFHQYLDITFPQYLYIGLLILAFGFLVWLIPLCFDFKLKLLDKQAANDVSVEEQKMELSLRHAEKALKLQMDNSTKLKD